ncbi:MAG: vitamin B12-dependent ribonucleotide reductase [Candidatus Bathyarchaeota archaeon]|nr:vitamin B12-dependent ribonucleotide reductase [Candidatus Bathyarchaeota archaeon]
MQLTTNAQKVLRARYLLKDEEGNIVETPDRLFRRVARAIARAEVLHNKKADLTYVSNNFYRIMSNLEFLPNSPTLMNAETKLGQLSACFVLPVDDSIRDIFRPVMYMGLIQQSGGGTGFSFSSLRPKGDIVKSTMGVASGPVSFMRVFDVATEVVKQGGKRRGANMGILSVNHPDIVEFITAKSDGTSFSNFNLSVAITDDFMEKVQTNKRYDLINPRTGKAVRKLEAKKVFDLIASSSWKTGDPGIVYIDEINRHHPTPHIGQIESTNPCGEQPLLAYESCNLGSINVSKFVKTGEVDWGQLREVIHLAVRFLDNVIDVNRYPLQEIEEVTKSNRKIGLGLMGFADMLIKLGIPYNSDEAISTAERLMKFISEEAISESKELASSKGSFPNFKGSLWEKKGFKGIRNATVTTIAPTGTISIIAGCSSGIEPLFAIVYVRNIMNGTRMLEVHPYFEKVAREQGFYTHDLIRRIAKTGSIKHFRDIPKDVRRVFVTAHEVTPEWHVKMQAAFQKHCDNAVSKTVNLPNNATIEAIKKIFWSAYKLKCKGITIYRYGSKKRQVLEFDSKIASEPNIPPNRYLSVGSDYSGGCPTGECPY